MAQADYWNGLGFDFGAPTGNPRWREERFGNNSAPGGWSMGDAWKTVNNQQNLLRGMGYGGEFSIGGGSGEGDSAPTLNPEFIDWANNQGLQFAVSNPDKDKNGGQFLSGIFDRDSNLVGKMSGYKNNPNDFITMVSLMAAPFAAPAISAAAGGGALGGAAAGAAMGGATGAGGALVNGGDLGDALQAGGKGALIGGATGAAGGAFGAGAGQYDLGGALGADGAWSSAINKGAGSLLNSAITGKNPTGGLISAGLGGLLGGDQTAALPGNQVGATNGGTMDGYDWGNVDFTSGGLPDLSGVNKDWLGNIDLTGGAFGGGMTDLSSYWKPEQMDFSAGQSGLLGGIKNLVGSAAGAVGGGSNLAALVGAGLGAMGGNKGQSMTSQQQIDPRMASYLYGTGVGDQNSLFGAAQKQWMDNKSGMNPAMQAGLDMQMKALQDPAYSKTYTDMRTQGTGLMNAPIAQNPFTGGPTAGTGLLPGGDRIQNLMAMGRGLLSA